MSLGLVSYGSSSDESSDNDEIEDKPPQVQLEEKPEKIKETAPAKPKLLNLPPPMSRSEPEQEEIYEEPININLPAPKTTTPLLIEEDDEFLKKKAIPTVKPPPAKKVPVRFVLPALSDFKDTDTDRSDIKKPIFESKEKKSSLFSILPKPKSEMVFTRPAASSSASTSKDTSISGKNSNLVPHSVRNKPKKTEPNKKAAKSVKSLVQKYSDSESSDDEPQLDFFSLNTKQSLPEVSANEIQAMIAEKAAKMTAISAKLDQMTAAEQNVVEASYEDQAAASSSSSNNLELDNTAMESLVGTSRAKRQKLLETNIIDISLNEIIQSKEEFLRQAMQQETQFIPTGRLVGNDNDEKSKKKHHITYLAHKAKANEAELQAMWSANRYTRQQTQNKYGF